MDYRFLKVSSEREGVVTLTISSPATLNALNSTILAEMDDFLDTLEMPFWKIPSGEVTNYPYLRAIAKTGKPVVMSTGMCSLEEIREAIRALKENGAGEIRLLHCNTEYPTPFEDVNLKAMQALRREFGLD